jgi:hypothetical protein
MTPLHQALPATAVNQPVLLKRLQAVGVGQAGLHSGVDGIQLYMGKRDGEVSHDSNTG